MIFNHSLVDQAETLLERARTAGVMIATAESCTGGLVAALLTEIPGSSDVVDRGFVTYSNAAKTEMLGIPARVIEAQGAVSDEVARRMAVALALADAEAACAGDEALARRLQANEARAGAQTATVGVFS